jgi:diaminohydroxyphosphoribosylaminopyrimidine deaminase/5-amino-6-(5-phosphoribosylamino)uracil reductase
MKNSDLRGQLPLNIYYELWKQSIIAIGRTAPNPPVSCVIAEKDTIISSGATEPPGQRHAEIVAFDFFDSLKLKGIKNLSLYVTLEPCSTYGRTGPCVLRIRNYKNIIKNIFIENFDPNLNKSGIKFLLENDLDVNFINIFKKPHFALEPFFSVIKRKRPIYYIKVATDNYGLIGINKKSISITGELGKIITMLLRSKVDAVIVGPGTVAIDKPSLDFRKIDLNIMHNEEILHNIEFLKEQTNFLYYYNSSIFYDEFIRGIILFYEDILKETQHFNYQPKRIFILGHYFKDFFSFYKKQIEITEKTNQTFYFLIQNSYIKQYPLQEIHKDNIRIIPDVKDKNFFEELNRFLIDINVHRILLETGANLFKTFYHFLTSEDHIYWIENQTKFLNEELKNIPIQDKRYWFFSQYNLVLKDKIKLKNLNIFSLSV